MEESRNITRHPLTLLSLTYLALLLFAALLLFFFGERHFLLICIRFTPPIVWLLPSMLFFSIALWKRRRVDILISIITASFVLFHFFDLQLGPPPRKATPDLRVVNWNVHHSSKGVKKLVDEIVALDANLLLLQEACEVPKYDWPDPVPAIKKRLPKWHFIKSRSLLTASKYPIKNRRLEKLGIHRPALIGELQVEDKTITVINVHLYVSTPGKPQLRKEWWRPIPFLNDLINVRQEASDLLFKVLSKTKGPLIIGGDFNTTPNSLICTTLDRQLTNAFKAAGTGFGLTYSTKLPLWRIDHLFVSKGITPTRCRVGKEKSSDHRPLITELILR